MWDGRGFTRPTRCRRHGACYSLDGKQAALRRSEHRTPATLAMSQRRSRFSHLAADPERRRREQSRHAPASTLVTLWRLPPGGCRPLAVLGYAATEAAVFF